MKKLLWGSFLSLLTIGQMLQAEVQLITIRWNPILCMETCVPLIERSLRAIPQVFNVYTNGPSGSANMEWDPKAPFSYEPFKFAAGAAGIRFNEIRLRVHGYILSDTLNFYLVSIGDDTRFRLIGPTQIEAGRYVVANNIEAHHLSPRLEGKLLDAKENDQDVIIEGPLFLPRSFPRTLIVEQFLIPKKQKSR